MKPSLFRLLVVWPALLLFTCSLNPAGTDEESYSIDLSLEKKGTTRATFTGSPISAIIAINDNSVYDLIDVSTGAGLDFNIGKGSYTWPATIGPDERPATIAVDLFWVEFPEHADTTKAGEVRKYDSVFVSVRGHRHVSNGVRVDVRNIAPVVQSVVIGNKTFPGQEDPIEFAVDTFTQVPIRFVVTDLNDYTIRAYWTPDSLLLYSNPSTRLNAIYKVPDGISDETRVVTIYDGAGGTVQRTLRLRNLGPNLRPLIDSIVAGGITFTDTFGEYNAPAFESVTFTAWARDPDGDSLRYAWQAGTPENLSVNSQNQARVTYTCPACAESLRTSVRIIDTLVCLAIDARRDTTLQFIQITHGSIAPVIDSIMTADTVWYPSDAITVRMLPLSEFSFMVAARGGTSKDPLRILASSANDIAIQQGNPGQFFYTAIKGTYEDVITVQVAAGAESQEVKMSVSVANTPPQWDSVTVVIDSVRKSAPDPTTRKELLLLALTGDTAVVRAIWSDADSTLGDSVTFSSRTPGQTAAGEVQGDSLRYAPQGSAGHDSLWLYIQDRSASIDSFLVILDVQDTSAVVE